MRPRIAIPLAHSGNHGYVQRVMPHYAGAIVRAGGEPVEIALTLDNHEIARLATLCDGVLLPGSQCDVNPEKYGQPRHPNTADPDALRDNADELLIQDAYNMRKPLLGICFGLQILNVWRTGTLLQHIATKVDHSPGSAVQHAHRVLVDPVSQLARILAPVVSPAGDGRPGAPLELMVNSSHHQAADLPGDGLRVVARCAEDGVIEAIEGLDPDHFVLAVQWHPERMPDDPAAQALFRAFVDAARQRHQYPRTPNPDFESLPK
jgi:putative glutamine amidotransferase